jgi:hypothetical protein
MPRKAKATPQQAANGPAQQSASQAAQPKAPTESIAGYFRRIFKENPKLLKQRSNDELLQRWQDDHPGHATIPDSVKMGLANIKSVLRKKRKRRGRPPGQSAQAPVKKAAPASGQSQEEPLERLEYLIDRCLAIARDEDAEGLRSIITHLRQARNELVLRLGSRR